MFPLCLNMEMSEVNERIKISKVTQFWYQNVSFVPAKKTHTNTCYFIHKKGAIDVWNFESLLHKPANVAKVENRPYPIIWNVMTSYVTYPEYSKAFLTYQCLKDRIIPVLIQCRQNLSHTAGLCEISVSIYEISSTRRWTSWRSKLSDKVGFLRLRRWLVQQRFKISNAYISFFFFFFFLRNISSVGMRLSLNKVNNLLPILFDFADIFRFARLPLILHVQIRE